MRGEGLLLLLHLVWLCFHSNLGNRVPRQSTCPAQLPKRKEIDEVRTVRPLGPQGRHSPARLAVPVWVSQTGDSISKSVPRGTWGWNSSPVLFLFTTGRNPGFFFFITEQKPQHGPSSSHAWPRTPVRTITHSL